MAIGTGLGTTAQAEETATLFPIEYHAVGGQLRGIGVFSSDPRNGVPGDAIQACDYLEDGYGIEAQLDTNGDGSPFHADRVASTAGHPVNSEGWYCTGWKTGDLVEDTWVGLRVCKVQGDDEWCGHMEWIRA